MSEREQELELVIRSVLADFDWERYSYLQCRRSDGLITALEIEELIRMADTTEAATVRRLEALVELAALRHTTVPMLFEAMGLGTNEPKRPFGDDEWANARAR